MWVNCLGGGERDPEKFPRSGRVRAAFLVPPAFGPRLGRVPRSSRIQAAFLVPPAFGPRPRSSLIRAAFGPHSGRTGRMRDERGNDFETL
ncbi:hypothetical protein WR25_25845 [Diploscapter pachys]|uniref:Uncharacterized protein n=1 Tax=Diploscapter pachys TaxID=2018661 RepID=A0A2A2JM19_9BILA|nr:hypothetical protein WR25_25845 [Diploscapter pachys]